jgi:4-amino-4-deoxy-L-arabinose transferase-like glycosyltransferase
MANQLNERRALIILVIISASLKLFMACTLELNDPEAYYWVFSRRLSLNYFDHPPMVAWMIWLTTFNDFFHSEWAIRLGAVLSSSICTVLIFKIGALLQGTRSGWFAALFYTCSLYGSIVAGVFVLPDSPEMVFWLASLFILIRLIRSDRDQPGYLQKWIWFGLLSGFCILSKAHGIFIWIGALCYACFYDRTWLTHRGFYFALIITIVMASPILIWNLQNEFVSYRFHSSRVTINSAIQPLRFVKQFLELVLIYNPVNFYFIVKSLIQMMKGKFNYLNRELSIILFCGLPLACILLIVSFFREIYPHWPGPAYSTLLLLPAIAFGKKIKYNTKWIPGILKLALTIVFLFASSLILFTRYYPGTTSSYKDGIQLGRGDAGLDLIGWRDLAIHFDSLYRSDVREHTMPALAPLIVTKWFPAAHEDFYLTHLTGQETYGIGGIDSLHQYYWMNQYKRPIGEGGGGYYVIPSNQFELKTFDMLTSRFSTYEMALTIPQYRSGVPCKQVYIFRLKGYKKQP